MSLSEDILSVNPRFGLSRWHAPVQVAALAMLHGLWAESGKLETYQCKALCHHIKGHI